MSRINGPPQGEGLQAVAMAFRILEYLAAQRSGVGVTELARALDTTKSRIHRHLRTLVESGYILQSPESEKYRIGSRLVTLGRAVDGLRVVTSGLSAGERVIVNGLQRVRPGSPVKAEEVAMGARVGGRLASRD